MVKNSNSIEIYLRIRPTKKSFAGFTLLEEEKSCEFTIEKKESAGYVNNTREKYNFKFDDIFNMNAKQEDLFEKLAQPVIESCFQGYNGTIFAYGQTGSGKTFTITGGGDRYIDRGLIPRSISYIYQQCKKESSKQINISISYLEIYQNRGYDLLDENHSSKNLHDLKQIQPMIMDDEQIFLKGLSVHKAVTEEDALNLLFIGDTNRVVSETPMNDASTRSHCIFLVQIESRAHGSDVNTVSRYHIVDLAGSERVGKTGVEGEQFKEAIGINYSLSVLEKVIVCLQKRGSGEQIHIPYRESLMTVILRDSLGGNCKTKMIGTPTCQNILATVSVEPENVMESISTMRFAARVSQIKQQAVINENVDPSVVIQRLKNENRALKAELALLKGGEVSDHLTPEDIQECHEKVENYLKSRDISDVIIYTDRLKINECFYHFKTILNRQSNGSVQENKSNQKPASITQTQPDIQSLEEIKKLKLLVKQRDNEIMILLNLANKNKDQTGQDLTIPVQRDQKYLSDISMISQQRPLQFAKYDQEVSSQTNNFQSKSTDIDQIYDLNHNQQRSIGDEQTQNSIVFSSVQHTKQTRNKDVEQVNQMLFVPLNLTNEQLMDRANCFELFRKSYRKNQLMEENKQILKEKYDRGKELGVVVNQARNSINSLKNQIEDIRKQNALVGLSSSLDPNQLNNQEEHKLTQQIEQQKQLYKQNFEELKDLKSEIEAIQLQIKNNREKMQRDFDKWLEVMLQQQKLDVQQYNKMAISQDIKSVIYKQIFINNKYFNNYFVIKIKYQQICLILFNVGCRKILFQYINHLVQDVLIQYIDFLVQDV